MKLKLQKKSIKSLQTSGLSTQQTPAIVGGVGQSLRPNECGYTQPAWHCMSYLGCMSNKPEFGC